MGVGKGGEKEREGERRGGEKRERKTVGEKVGQEEEYRRAKFYNRNEKISKNVNYQLVRELLWPFDKKKKK